MFSRHDWKMFLRTRNIVMILVISDDPVMFFCPSDVLGPFGGRTIIKSEISVCSDTN